MFVVSVADAVCAVRWGQAARGNVRVGKPWERVVAVLR